MGIMFCHKTEYIWKRSLSITTNSNHKSPNGESSGWGIKYDNQQVSMTVIYVEVLNIVMEVRSIDNFNHPVLRTHSKFYGYKKYTNRTRHTFLVLALNWPWLNNDPTGISSWKNRKIRVETSISLHQGLVHGQTPKLFLQLHKRRRFSWCVKPYKKLFNHRFCRYSYNPEERNDNLDWSERHHYFFYILSLSILLDIKLRLSYHWIDF